MITLKEAIKLIDINDRELCYIRNKGSDKYGGKYLRIKEIRDKFDMKNTFVTKITPKFSFYGEYEGIEFEIASSKFRSYNDDCGEFDVGYAITEEKAKQMKDYLEKVFNEEIEDIANVINDIENL